MASKTKKIRILEESTEYRVYTECSKFPFLFATFIVSQCILFARINCHKKYLDAVDGYDYSAIAFILYFAKHAKECALYNARIT